MWLPGLLVRLGVKGPSAALCANFLYILLSLFFVHKLAGFWGNTSAGGGAVYGVALTPIFFQYLIRANQEHPLNLAVLAGLYGLSRSHESRRYQCLFAAALIFAVLIKGANAVMLSLLAVLFWLMVRRTAKTLRLIVLAHLLAFGIIVLFEVWYRAVTQETFWLHYFSIQGARSLGFSFRPLDTLYNFCWYVARVLWFSTPWVLFLFYGLSKSKKREISFFQDRFLRFVVVGSLAILFLFSLSGRKADRYIFPAYMLLAVAGILVFLKANPKALDFLERHERRLPLALCVLLVVSSFLRILFHAHFYRFIRFWPQ
jgi:4-amino-4-deoxy-L-arabinose transferase-like glycosyltransferase